MESQTIVARSWPPPGNGTTTAEKQWPPQASNVMAEDASAARQGASAIQVRFDIHAERAEYERLFRHSARVLQDRLVRLGGDRTKEIPVTEWERLYQKAAQARSTT
jgi:hypothetical protein